MPAKGEEQMERSRYIAGLIGPVFVVAALAMIANRGLMSTMADQVAGNYVIVLIGGACTLVAGVAIVRSHNVWFGWPVLITAIGWFCVIGGALRMIFPRAIGEIAPRFSDEGWVTVAESLVMAAVGLFMIYQGYFKKAPPQ
jgi:cytochrome bd-type quinol oxidase subunit 2